MRRATPGSWSVLWLDLALLGPVQVHAEPCQQVLAQSCTGWTKGESGCRECHESWVTPACLDDFACQTVWFGLTQSLKPLPVSTQYNELQSHIIKHGMKGFLRRSLKILPCSECVPIWVARSCCNEWITTNYWRSCHFRFCAWWSSLKSFHFDEDDAFGLCWLKAFDVIYIHIYYIIIYIYIHKLRIPFSWMECKTCILACYTRCNIPSSTLQFLAP